MIPPMPSWWSYIRRKACNFILFVAGLIALLWFIACAGCNCVDAEHGRACALLQDNQLKSVSWQGATTSRPAFFRASGVTSSTTPFTLSVTTVYGTVTFSTFPPAEVAK